MRIGQTLYFDHQATTPVDERVLAEMTPFFSDSFGNAHSVDHTIGWQAAKAVEKAAIRVGRLIGADADEIVFTSGATEANNLALLGLGRRCAAGNRRRILVSSIEHKCVLAAGRALQEQLGYQLELLPVDAHGFVDQTVLKNTLSDDVLAVSVMAVNNEIGTIEDIVGLSAIIRESGALFHCDAAQAPCAIDLKEFSTLVDLLSLSGHKMYGPQGIGTLFVRRNVRDCIEPLLYGGGQQGELRSGTVPVALCVGMGAAAALLNTDTAAEKRTQLRRRTQEFVRALRDLDWPIVLNGVEGAIRHPGNANMRFKGFDARDILGSMQPRMAASTGSACTSGNPEPSHILRAIGLSGTQADSSIRFSLGCGTTDADVVEAVELIDESLLQLSIAQ